jgi:hypothetical protein
MQKHAGLTARAFTQALQGGFANMQRLRCPAVRSVGILLSILRPFRPVNVMIACRRAMPRCNKTELIERTCPSTISRANQLLPSWYFWTRCHYQRPSRIRFDCNLGTPIFSLAHIIFNHELHARLLFCGVRQNSWARMIVQDCQQGAASLWIYGTPDAMSHDSYPRTSTRDHDMQLVVRRHSRTSIDF